MGDGMRTSEQALQLVRVAMAHLFGMEPQGVQLSVHLRDDLELDSLDVAELLTELEERTGLYLMDRIWEAVDVTSLVNLITGLDSASGVGEGARRDGDEPL
jgi:acyl carrier protein